MLTFAKPSLTRNSLIKVSPSQIYLRSLLYLSVSETSFSSSTFLSRTNSSSFWVAWVAKHWPPWVVSGASMPIKRTTSPFSSLTVSPSMTFVTLGVSSFVSDVSVI